jgi:hypothetical protein
MINEIIMKTTCLLKFPDASTFSEVELFKESKPKITSPIIGRINQ